MIFSRGWGECVDLYWHLWSLSDRHDEKQYFSNPFDPHYPDHTVTFGYRKIGHSPKTSSQANGQRHTLPSKVLMTMRREFLRMARTSVA